MKKIFFLKVLFVILLFSSSLIAQEEYIPTVVEGAHWYIGYWGPSNGPGNTGGTSSRAYAYAFKGDTTIQGEKYKKLFYQLYYDGEMLDHGYEYFKNRELISEKAIAFYREDLLSRKIYARFAETPLRPNCTNTEEHLQFDFSYEEGDIISKTCQIDTNEELVIENISPIVSFEKPLKRIEYSSNYSPSIYVLEGFGSGLGPYQELHTYYVTADHSFWLQYYCLGKDEECLDRVVSNKNVFSEVEFSIAPNPASNTIFARLDFDKKYSGKLQINSAFGQVLLEKNLGLESNEYEIDISKLIKGMYILTYIEEGSVRGSRKFIKK